MLSAPTNMIFAQDLLGIGPVDPGAFLPGAGSNPPSAFPDVMQAVLVRDVLDREGERSIAGGNQSAPLQVADFDTDKDPFRDEQSDPSVGAAGMAILQLPETPVAEEGVSGSAHELMSQAVLPVDSAETTGPMIASYGDLDTESTAGLESTRGGASVADQGISASRQGEIVTSPVELSVSAAGMADGAPVSPVDNRSGSESVSPAVPMRTPPPGTLLRGALEGAARGVSTVATENAGTVPFKGEPSVKKSETSSFQKVGFDPSIGVRAPNENEVALPVPGAGRPSGRGGDVNIDSNTAPGTGRAPRVSRSAPAGVPRDTQAIDTTTGNLNVATEARVRLRVSPPLQTAERVVSSPRIDPPGAIADERPVQRAGTALRPGPDPTSGESGESNILPLPAARPAGPGRVEDPAAPAGTPVRARPREPRVETSPSALLETLPLAFSLPDAATAGAAEMGNSPRHEVTVARPETLGPALKGEAVRILEHLGGKTGEFSAEIQLHPRELGRVHIEMSVSDHRMKLHLTVENGEVRHLVQAHANDLRHAMEDRGYVLSDVNVFVAHDGGDPSRFGSFSERSDGWNHLANSSSEEPVARATRQILTDTRVNVLA